MSGFLFSLSESAKERIVDVLSEHPAGCVRVSVVGGGCSGFSYKFSIDEAVSEDDHVIVALSDERREYRVLVDSLSSAYLHQASLDYRGDEFSRVLVVDNPNATASCGCGSSFSI